MKSSLKNILVVFFSLLLLSSCNNDIQKGPKIKKSDLPDIEISIHRYGKALFNVDTNNFLSEIKGLQNEFRLFLGDNIDDPSVLSPLYEYVTDTQLISISKKTNQIFTKLF